MRPLAALRSCRLWRMLPSSISAANTAPAPTAIASANETARSFPRLGLIGVCGSIGCSITWRRSELLISLEFFAEPRFLKLFVGIR